MTPLALREPVVRASAYLHPGELTVSAGPLTITTILGSCVGVCLFDPRTGVGGMNHYLLPDSFGARPTSRFGDVAMAQLLAEVRRSGARPRGLRARVFGGACVLDAFRTPGNHLGERNAEVALRFLEAERIPVIECDTGGRRGRRLQFNTDDGSALLQLI